MNLNQRQAFVEAVLKEAQQMCLKKGAAYADDDDALSNFKDCAKESGTTPFQVWHILQQTHCGY